MPKGNAGTDVTQYRPIAVLSVFGKIFETVIDQRINQQIAHSLDEAQHGFRSGRSTTTNHICFVDYAAAAMDCCRQVDVAYFDFKKAFDLVDNDLLLQKFAKIGFAPELLRFFADYLSNRSQYVKLAGFQSKPYYTRSGVSQGSTLGPTQFLIMINDLPSVVRAAVCLMYADDLKLCLDVGQGDDCLKLQHDINAVAEWSVKNKLHFNVSKCKVMTFSRARAPIEFSYVLQAVQLERVYEIRDLGLTLDVQLNFRQHIINICKSASKTLGFIIRMTTLFSNVRIAVLLYNAYVRSKVEFGAIVWDPYESKYISMVEKIQKKFARYLYSKCFGYYPYLYPSLFVSGMLGLDTLELRRKLLLMDHYYGIINNRINNSSVLERMGLHVPTWRGSPELELPPRRRRRLFAWLRARTRQADNAPTPRALAVLNAMAVEGYDIDIFADSVGGFRRKCSHILNVLLFK